MEIKINMEYAKETQNTHVYHAGKDEVITALYIQKKAFKDEPPKEIILTVKDKEKING